MTHLSFITFDIVELLIHFAIFSFLVRRILFKDWEYCFDIIYIIGFVWIFLCWKAWFMLRVKKRIAFAYALPEFCQHFCYFAVTATVLYIFYRLFKWLYIKFFKS